MLGMCQHPSDPCRPVGSGLGLLHKPVILFEKPGSVGPLDAHRQGRLHEQPLGPRIGLLWICRARVLRYQPPCRPGVSQPVGAHIHVRRLEMVRRPSEQTKLRDLPRTECCIRILPGHLVHPADGSHAVIAVLGLLDPGLRPLVPLPEVLHLVDSQTAGALHPITTGLGAVSTDI